MKQKFLSLGLAFVLLLSCLAGCGSKTEAPENTVPPADTGAPAAEPTAAPTQDPEADDAEEPSELDKKHAFFAPAYEKYSPDTVVMRVDGTEVTWQEYFSWIYNLASQMYDYYAVEDWNEVCPDLVGLVEDPSYNGYLSTYASLNCLQLSVIRAKAEALGVMLDESQIESLDLIFDNYYAQLGGDEDAFRAALAKGFLDADYFRTQMEASMLYDNLFTLTFGENGEACPEEDAIQYVKDQGYLIAKHILFKTVDDAREPLPAEEIARKKADAEAVLQQLQSCSPAELPAKFEELLQQYGEDPGMNTYTDGYYFLSGAMVEPFENAARALGDNELSDIVESSYGFHILYRPAMSGDHLMDYDDNYQPYTVRSFAASALFSNVADGWYDAAEVEFMPGFEKIDMNVLLGE